MTHQVDIELDEGGHGHVRVDGHDLPAYRVEITGNVHEPTEVVVYMRDVVVKMKGLAQVVAELTEPENG